MIPVCSGKRAALATPSSFVGKGRRPEGTGKRSTVLADPSERMPPVNYLAHLYLAGPDPDARLGNLLGDFVQGADLGALPGRIRAGILAHRRIDAFADAHPVFRRSRARISAPLARFSGVLVDVFYDHFLARDWERWHPDLSLDAFCARVYADLDLGSAWLPPRFRRAAPIMVREDWLGSYREIAGIETALAHMAGRLRRPSRLGEGGRELRASYRALGDDFAEFFPQVVELAAARGLTSP